MAKCGMVMENELFKKWPKIKRGNPFAGVITEKMDGTNSCIIIRNGEIVGTQSRNRLITAEDDNFGFAAWVEENRAKLTLLGDGYHYGEWVGPGIQKNRHRLEKRTFYLFDYFKTDLILEDLKTVPLLFSGEICPETISQELKKLEQIRSYPPEGIICYFKLSRFGVKYTFQNPNGKWLDSA